MGVALLAVVAIPIVSFRYFFTLFGEPEYRLISATCDPSGQVTSALSFYSGNAVSLGSLHVTLIKGCDGDLTNSNQRKAGKSVFVVDGPAVDYSTKDVVISWNESLSLAVEYDSTLRVFRQDSLVVLPGNDPLKVRIQYHPH